MKGMTWPALPPQGLEDAQRTEKSVFYRFLSLLSVYGQKVDLWTNRQIFRLTVKKHGFYTIYEQFSVRYYGSTVALCLVVLCAHIGLGKL